ncbi:MAG: prolipoprotein diacylglyceryl transferase [Actinobacteria bacterium]|nr:prolipoprotein diacylglyceryl transferase [Actinomycetota bacterium]
MRALLASFTYDPIVHIPIGPLRISPHGIGIAVGFLLGARLMLPEAQRKGIGEDAVYAILVRAAVGSLIGARLAYVVNHAGDYLDDPLSALKVWEGGISLLGGIFGAIAFALPLARRFRFDAWKGLDAAAPGLALGIIVGRIGDLVVGDHLGKPTGFFLGYRCPPEGVDTASPCLGEVVHQTALYDLVLTCGLLALLLVLRRRPRYDGFLMIVFGAWYGTGRLIEDFLREDVRRFGLTASQWTALATVIVCTVWLVLVRRTPRWGRWGETGAGPEEASEPPAPTMAAPTQNVEDP